MRVATLTLHDRAGAALHTVRYGRMPQLGAPEVLDSLRADLKALLGRRRLEVVLLCDGAQELVDLLDGAFNEDSLGVRVHRLVDFWHVAEKLGAAATVLFGAAASGVLQRWKGAAAELRACAHPHPQGALRFWQTRSPGRKERPVHAAITYLENQGDRMGYVEARALGLPIGSSNVEATCKSLVGQHMVRTGSRWKECTGQHILDLRDSCRECRRTTDASRRPRRHSSLSAEARLQLSAIERHGAAPSRARTAATVSAPTLT